MMCIECGTRPTRVRQWCWTCYGRVRQRVDFLRVQRKVSDLEVRRCTHCLVPMPVGRTNGGLCDACVVYQRRSGTSRPLERHRELEGLDIAVGEFLAGRATIEELREAYSELRIATDRFMTTHARHRQPRKTGMRWIVSSEASGDK